MNGEVEGKLAFVGDVHLDRDDEHLAAFLSFLDRLGKTCRRIVLMGDLFNIWIGRRELEQPHHRAVVDRLTQLRASGCGVRYLEGNRDYRVGPCYGGEALDDTSEEGLVERFGGHVIFAVHGDLANVADRRYRAWRRLSRSALVWGAFNLLPRSRRNRIAERLERRLRRTNPDFKRGFPEAAVRAYASTFLAAGHDTVVLGHFHVERDLESRHPPGRILVLPDWKGSRRHLEVRPDGGISFVDSR